MRTSSLRSLRSLASLALATVTAGLFVGACGGDPDLSDPEEAGPALGEALCGYLSGCCGGDAVPGGSESACVDQIAAQFKILVDQGESEGYQYDPRCVETQIDLLSGADCSLSGASFAQPLGSCVPTCYGGYVHGTAKQGEACEDPRDCDFGLICNGTCTDPCGAQAGSACGNVGETFVVCRADAFCEPDESDPNTGTCAPLPRKGEACTTQLCAPGFACIDGVCEDPRPNGGACTQPTGCASGYCDPTDPQNPVCASPPGPGESCTYLCTTDAFCDGETCIALPTPGQPCPSSVCAAGAICREGLCVAESELLCSAFEGD